MIFYFSGTGNSEHVAARLAEATGEACFSMAECLDEKRLTFQVKAEERIGFVTPVYFWGLPSVVVDFMHRVDLQTQHQPFVYHVVTFGTTTGEAHHMMGKLLEQKGLKLAGKYNVKMVDVWTPMFDVSNREKCLKITHQAEKQIDQTIVQVQDRVEGNFDYRRAPHWVARWYYRTYESERRTSRFKVLAERCIGCGLCAAHCPVHAIEMKEDRPVWTKEKCVMCVRCLHHCPEFAIHCGKRTLQHGQFVHPQAKR